jgi:hypothetical protein
MGNTYAGVVNADSAGIGHETATMCVSFHRQWEKERSMECSGKRDWRVTLRSVYGY